MKLTHYIYISILLAALTACSDDITAPHYTVGEADNAITLRAGISEGGVGVQTRAVDGNHGKHVAFSTEHLTQLRLRVDGTWRKSGSESNEISQPTTATTDAKTGTGNLHNSLTFSPTLYWDDYGTADPENMSLKDNSDFEQHIGNGRGKGLTIYGVAVNEKNLPTTAADGRASLVLDYTSANWQNISWNVGKVENGVIDQSTSGWGDYDLLTSNNIRSTDNGGDGTYKFDDYVAKLTDNNYSTIDLLEFTHTMSKITVNLTAGKGFPGYETGATNAKFQKAPTVVLKGFNYIGKVNAETKISTPTQADGTTETTPVATTNIKMHSTTGDNVHSATLDALVFPGNKFTATITDEGNGNKTVSSTDPLLELNADGNIYKVTAAQLVKAIANPRADQTGSIEGTLAQGVNYVINITVNKTEITVTATVKDWDEIDADDEIPVIDISANYGQTTATGVGSFDKTYDFFRSLSIASGYDADNTADGINPAATFTYSNSSYTQNKFLYWPNHDTHYFFRGVYPVIGTAAIGLATSQNLTVTKENSNEVIAVENVEYTVDTWPSDLAIALPRTTNTACTAHSKTPLDNGICATKGTITMNFEYAMSKVEVRLKSSANSTDPDYVALNTITVEVVGGYNKGRITLKDGLHDTWIDNSDKGDYTLHQLSTPVDGFQQTTRDAIIPQELGNDVKFKITVNNSDGTKDIYYAQLNQIKGKKHGAADDTKAFITEWKHGEHYIYELTVTKTEIKVTATLTDWVPVSASDDIWF